MEQSHVRFVLASVVFSATVKVPDGWTQATEEQIGGHLTISLNFRSLNPLVKVAPEDHPFRWGVFVDDQKGNQVSFSLTCEGYYTIPRDWPTIEEELVEKLRRAVGFGIEIRSKTPALVIGASGEGWVPTEMFINDDDAAMAVPAEST